MTYGELKTALKDAQDDTPVFIGYRVLESDGSTVRRYAHTLYVSGREDDKGAVIWSNRALDK